MENQVDAISDLVDAWRQKAKETQFPYADVFQQAITDFQKFSYAYQDYFEDLVEEGSYNHEKTTGVRLRYQYMETLEGYWLSLEQVILQWQVEYYRKALEQAYEESMSFLKNLDLSLPGILIYFNKVANIRYLPFTGIPILGISHLFSGSERWSAISHEIGHYLFWNLGSSLGETRKLQKKLKTDAAQFLTESGIGEKQRDLTISWLEEVFSDIIGTRVDGVQFLQRSEEFIESQAGNESERTLVVDRHPPLIFRPLIWRQALKSADETIQLPPPVRNFDGTAEIKFCPLIISGEEKVAGLMAVPGDQDFETLRAEELRPAIEKLVKFLTGKLGGILSDIRLIKGKRATAFQKLKRFLEEEKQTSEKLKEKEIYELLLQPRTFEGAYSHAHGLQSLHGWHELGTHSH